MPKRTWYWDADAQRYRYAASDGGVGRLVPEKYIKSDINRVADGVRDELRAITQQLVDGNITKDAWYKSMKQTMKLSYRTAFVAANGMAHTPSFFSSAKQH